MNIQWWINQKSKGIAGGWLIENQVKCKKDVELYGETNFILLMNDGQSVFDALCSMGFSYSFFSRKKG